MVVAMQLVSPFLQWWFLKESTWIMNGEVPGTVYGMSERGWRAFSFLAETLSKLCQPWPPLVAAPGWTLIHFELGTIELDKEKDVVIFACPLTLHTEVNL